MVTSVLGWGGAGLLVLGMVVVFVTTMRVWIEHHSHPNPHPRGLGLAAWGVALGTSGVTLTIVGG
jgi:hypothetical protein